MATNLEFNRGNSTYALRGLNNNELQSAATLKGGKSTAIENRVASLSSKEASVFLSNLRGKIHDRPGYLKLMHTEHNRTMAFETKSGLGSLFTKNERRSETESALKGLFRALKLKDDQLKDLNSRLSNLGGDHLQARDAASIIEEALKFSQMKEQSPTNSASAPIQLGTIQASQPKNEVETRLAKNLDAFRTISVGGIEIGGSARPAGATYLKNGTSVSDVLNDIKSAGFTHILSVDQSERPEYSELKEGIKSVDLQHLAPEELDIADAGFATGNETKLYEKSKPLDVNALKAFKSQVDKVKAENGKMLVHCGAGAGRTGTMLASLLLADLVKNNGDSKRSVRKEHPVDLHEGEAYTTPLVAMAIETLRKADTAFTGKAKSVETELEVRLLEIYEKELFANA